MRVVQLLPSMRRAGAETVVYTLSAGLARHGVEVDLAIMGGRFDYENELADSGVRVFRLGLFEGPVRFYQRLLRRRIEERTLSLLMERRPDILHCHLPHGLIFSSNAAARLGIPTFYTMHGVNTSILDQGIVAWWRRHEYVRAIRVSRCSLLAVSAAVEERMSGIARQAHADPIQVQVNPIDLGAIVSCPGVPRPKGGEKVAVMVGTLYPLKRVRVGLAAIRKLRDQGARVELWVVGNGEDRSALERLSAELGIENNVKFLGVRRDVPQILKSCDLLWLLSEHEGLPMVVLEAMAAGVPVVATDVPGTNELVRHNVNGLLVRLDDADAVAQATTRVLNDEELQRHLVAGGADTARRFSVDIVVAEHLARYRAMLEKRGVSLGKASTTSEGSRRNAGSANSP